MQTFDKKVRLILAIHSMGTVSTGLTGQIGVRFIRQPCAPDPPTGGVGASAVREGGRWHT